MVLLCSFGHADTVKDAHTELELVPEVMSFVPGDPFWVALRMTMDEGWHVYWQNPGDSGLAARISWRLPESFQAGPVLWPYPKRLDMPPLTTYGYEEEVFLLTEIFPSDHAMSGDTVEINADVTWLACKIECLPGNTTVTLTLPASDQPAAMNLQWQEQFAHFKRNLPTTITDWQITASEDNGHFIIRLDQPDERRKLKDLQFFPYRNDLIDHAAFQQVEKDKSGYQLIIEKSNLLVQPVRSIQGVLVNDEGWGGSVLRKALEIEVDVGDDLVSGEIQGTGKAPSGSVWQAMIFAFLGGIILNAMPCVLPVLSLKIFGLLERSRKSRKESFLQGGAYCAGILVSFWILLAVLLVLKSAGKQVGWGFQFQSAGFLVFITSVLSILALNLLGVFEIGTALTALGVKMKKEESWPEAFFNGVLATIVATPCTAPFMGTALGFALVQPLPGAFVIFTFLGFGLAFPYLLVTVFPGFSKIIPKPGEWMVHLKRSLSFPLLMTVLWLAWVLGRQYGIGAMVALLYGQLIMAIGWWVWGTWSTPLHDKKVQRIARLVAAMFITGGILLAYSQVQPGRAVQQRKYTGTGINWQPFFKRSLDQLLMEGRPVFINFTADWCLTCKVNEEIVFKHPDVIRAFQQNDIQALKADWTVYDPAVTEQLSGLGHSSVPLYVYYPEGQNSAVILPELITPKVVTDTLEQN